MLGTPRLRDSHVLARPYPLGELSEKARFKICRSLAYLIAVGEKDLSGDKWEQIFANGIEGTNLSRPLGLADVVKDSFSWSVKTVKNTNPHKAKTVRIISGRNNVTYSFGIENPLEDIALTGEAVLAIYNERVKAAKSGYKDLTHAILVRSPDLNEFTYFEKDADFVNPKDIRWEKNERGNLQGFDAEGKHVFTWQPNGSQFTILYTIPDNAQKFTLKRPDSLDFDSVIELIGFDQDWIETK
ncbi:hypothetical protein LRP49_18800 [Enterovibrio sp. ZSDZ35]|uniref:RES domain-containing protein n=1 Tax=Enterovibrio qingdaonensis TaxID=2899818 RepID=A0ABT5QQG5_9GAMM|nr:hypothetical protein [Enterovibrio sp. ZSDZ35]MDD1783221.1 hypothetical protein [Enterovibrio sp. ZSDZ35]